MSGENWESLITEKGFMRVPRALRLKRAELGITNNEYTILLDYVDYYSFSGTMNPYRHLTEVSGMSERGIRRILTSLENKGLLKRVVNLHGNGRTKGVVFSIAPLVRRLKTVMKKMSSTVGEEIVPYVGEKSVPPNTGEEINKREEDKNTSVKNTDVRARECGDDLNVKEAMSLGETTEGRNKRQISHASVRNDKHVGTDVDGVYDGEGTGEAGDTSCGFIRGTGGPDQEAPRNDRRPARESDAVTEGGKASQIHLARAGEGPQGLVSGEEYGRQQNKIHPNPPLQRRELNAKDEIATIADSGGGVMDESYPGTGSASFRPSTGSGRTVNGSSADLNDEPAEVPLVPRNDRRIERGEYSPSRWYNEVWRGLYEEAAGQPALTGGREYGAAETYFRRLRELNPEMEPGEVYELAGEGAAFMIASQLEGGVFGWMHKPPDICMLASQAQSVEWHLRKMRRVAESPRDDDPHPDPPSPRLRGTSPPPGRGREIILDVEGSESSDINAGSVPFRPSTGSGRAGNASPADSGGREMKKSYMCADSALRERLREGQNANEQIERVYGELRGIECASRSGGFENDGGRDSGRTFRPFDPSTLRQSSGQAGSGRTVERRALRRGRG
ncbi:MAG: hypothetical protein AB1598_05995 [Thermodesulfobacteriota bacterium]